MVSHEMRTPLLSIVFFLNKVLNLLINENFDEANVMEMIKMCSNCITQLELVQSFVDDLLDLG